MGKTLEELYQERDQLIDEIDEMTSSGKALTSEQVKAFDRKERRARRLNAEIHAYNIALQEATPRTASGMNPGTRGPFTSLGDQLRAVALAASPGGRVDERLYEVQNAAGANEGVGSEGGFLVQTDHSTALLDRVIAEGVLAQRCNRIPLSSGANGITLPQVDESSRANGSRWGGVQSFWTAEAAEITSSKPKFKTVNLELRKLAGLCFVTEELLEDGQALEKVVSQGFSDEINFRLDDAIFRGDGAGKPLGILNSDALVSVDKESGQASDSVVYENLVAMWARMPARNRGNAVWLTNQEIEPQLYSMSLAVGTGGSAIFLPGGQASSEPYSTFFGRPIIPIEQASALGDKGDIVLADLGQYLLAEKGGLKIASSIHVRFIYDERAFRFTLRVDGCPAWSAPLTPYKGASTLSPFVTLQART
jgi:HK97 family phage major capsid protein